MKNERTFEDLKILKSKHVHMKDESVVIQKINKIIGAGANKLQVITDFDLTLTKQHQNGMPILSSFGIFRKCRQLPEKFKTESRELYKKYRALEINPFIPMNEKSNYMREWMTQYHQMLKGLKFNQKEIQDMVDLYGLSLRDRTKELFLNLKNLNVPILVFSAGLGDVVEASLKHQNVLFSNVNIISNFLEFQGDILNGFKNSHRIIHVFNKNEHSVENEYFKILEGRKNIILMGDSLGDALMADGVDTDVVLRIGFLYDHVEDSLPIFKEAFDIVLVDDQTMNVVLEIVGSIS